MEETPPKPKAKRKLTLMQEKFVQAYLRNGCRGKDAAIEAGYSVKCAKEAAYDLLHETPHVMEAVGKAREEVRQKLKYDRDAAIEEGERLMAKAEAANQFTAVANFYHTKNKIAGNIIEKHDVRSNVSFKIDIIGIETEKPVEEIGEQSLPPQIEAPKEGDKNE